MKENDTLMGSTLDKIISNYEVSQTERVISILPKHILNCERNEKY